MKFLAALALVPLALSAVMPRDLDADNLPDGRYIATIQQDGTEETTFVPWAELNTPGFAPLAVNVTKRATSLSARDAGDLKKRNGCEGYILNDSEVDQANECVLTWTVLDPMPLGTKQKISCVRGIAKSYICAYTTGQKSKFETRFSWAFIRNPQCGPQRAGWNSINGGSGNWDAGYTLNNAGFCGF